jgi:hypothetical protein
MEVDRRLTLTSMRMIGKSSSWPDIEVIQHQEWSYDDNPKKNDGQLDLIFKGMLLRGRIEY